MKLARSLASVAALLVTAVGPSTAHAVSVTIETGQYQGQLDVGNDGDFFSGDRTVDLDPGWHFIRPGSQFSFHVDASGLVTLAPEHDGISASGGMNVLSLLTTPVTIDPDAFAGEWSIGSGRTQPDTRGAATVQLVPSNAVNADGSIGARHTLEIGIGTSKIVMNVLGDGSLSVADGNDALATAVDVDGATLTFRNIDVEVTDRDSSGIAWLIRQATADWPSWGTGDQAVVLVPDVRYLFQTSVGVSELFWMYQPCDPAPVSVDVNGSFFDIECVPDSPPGLITVTFSGNVNIISDTDGFLARAGVSNGDLLEGEFVYDLTTAPHSQGTGVAQYWPESYAFNIGGSKVSYQWPTGCCGSGIVIRDNFSTIGDMMTTSFSGDLVNNATGETGSIYSTNGWIADNTGGSWSTTALPDLATLSEFVDPSTNPGYQSFSRIQGNSIDFTLSNYSWSAQATVVDEPPTAAAGDDQAIRAGDSVFLDGSQSFDDNTAAALLAFSWSFDSVPAGSTASLQFADTATPSFVADEAGTYVVRLTVTDEVGQESPPDTVEISSDNLAPTAVAGADRLVLVGETVLLDGSPSFDPEFDPIAYAWSLASLPAGSVASLSSLDSATTTFAPDVPGTFVVDLVVSDAIGPGAPDSVTVVAATPESVATASILDANAILEGLSNGAVTTSGNQRALANFLSQAVAAIDAGDLSEAVAKIDKSLLRVDGCSERGLPDGNGKGRDWVLECGAQVGIYDALVSARSTLL